MQLLSSEKLRTKPSLAMLFAAALCLGVVLGPKSAFAHNVNIFAYVDGNQIVTESYFNDGKKCRDSTIEVFGKNGEKLVDGKTDDNGRFVFPIPQKTDLLIRLSASMGHQAEYTVPAAELPGDAAESSAPAASQARPEAKTPAKTGEARADERKSPEGALLMSEAEIEASMEKVLTRELLPIRRALEESRRKQRFSDVVGGIGYIVGLMGLAAYFLGKRKQG